MKRIVILGGFAALVAVGVWYAVTHFPLAESAPETAIAGVEATPAPAKALLQLQALGPACGERCGIERWAIKTLSDVDRDRVSFVPVRATVEELAALPRPAVSPADRRAGPVELTTYEVRGCLAGLNRRPEADGDIHVIVFGLQNQRVSLIGEIPHPACGGVCQSGLGVFYARARFVLDSVLASGRVSPECNYDARARSCP